MITSREHPWVAYHQETNLTWLVDKNKLTKNIQKTKRMVAYKLKLVQPETISLSEIAPKIYSWVPLK